MNKNMDETETIVTEAKRYLTHNFIKEHCLYGETPYTVEYYVDNTTGKISGPVKAIWGNGIVKEQGQYKDGKRDGRFERWHFNGQMHSYCVFDSEKVLECAAWSQDGVLGIQNTLNGSTLNRKVYWPNGNPLLEDSIQGLKAHGIKRAWFFNGQMKIDALYHNGKRHQDYKEWNESGDLIVYRTYKHGKIIAVHV